MTSAWLAQLQRSIEPAQQGQCERLAQRLDLVETLLHLVHQCQSERGLTNLWLGQSDNQSEPAWLLQTEATDAALAATEQAIVEWQQRAAQLPQSVTLLHRLVQWSEQAASITQLRNQVAAGDLNAADATRQWSGLIADQSALVFSALNLDLPSELCREITLLLQLTQAKEYTGHERAWVSFGLAMGQFDPPILQRVQRIRQHQQQALESAVSLGAMALTDHATYQQFEAMQALIDGFSPSQPVPPTLAETWFGVVSDWIDQLLAAQLASVAALRRGLAEPIAPSVFARDPSPSGDERTDPLRSVVGASFGLYELISEQSQHLAEVRSALQAARRELARRKRIEQAKGLLMQFQGLSEAEAFGVMRARAMQTSTSLETVAERIIDTVERTQKRTD